MATDRHLFLVESFHGRCGSKVIVLDS